MGRTKDSVKEKKLRGTYRKDREEKQASAGGDITDVRWCITVSGYKELSKRAKGIYRAVCHEMIDGPGLYKSQLRLLVIYANTYETYLKADEDVQKEGLLFKYYDTAGNLRRSANPALIIREEASKQLRQFSKDFGIQSIDRQKLKLPEEEANDPLTEFLEKFE